MLGGTLRHLMAVDLSSSRRCDGFYVEAASGASESTATSYLSEFQASPRQASGDLRAPREGRFAGAANAIMRVKRDPRIVPRDAHAKCSPDYFSALRISVGPRPRFQPTSFRGS